MKAHEKAKKAGFKSLLELSEYAEESPQNLNNWHKYKPRRFELILKGAVVKRLEEIK
jgi:hypothetical protein